MCFLIAVSQDMSRIAYSYGRKIVDTLASSSMHGRGYVNNGDGIAAQYIKNEFQKFNLQSFGTDYYQSFEFPINTYPDEISFSCSSNDKSGIVNFKGISGENFIISPSSPSINTGFSTVVFDSTYAASNRKFGKFRKKIKSRNIFVIVDSRGITNKSKLDFYKKVKAGYFDNNTIEIVEKLSWTQSQEVSKYVRIQVLADSFPCKGNGEGNVLIKNTFIPYHATQNVVGYVKGSVYPDSFLVFSAHYDHLGQMGKEVYFPGANDNASGCAMLLNLANYYAMPQNRPRYSIAFIAFAGEEVGLLGSKYYTEHPLFPLKNISFLLNVDMMGTGEEGITVVNGSVFKPEFDALVAINNETHYLEEVRIRGKAANSDHYFFSENGVKAFFIYTMGGIKAYHDVYDRPETLPLTKFEEIFKMIIKFGEYLQH